MTFLPQTNLYQQWLEAKDAEREATEARRVIEDQLIQQLGVDDTRDGSKTHKLDGYKVTVTTRINRTVDADLVQDIAAEHGLTHHLGQLFRWKPDINKRAWEEADAAITGPLSAAVTAKPGRPSFKIEQE